MPQDDIFRVTESSELFRLLTKRKHWNRIRPEILWIIFRNSEADILRIRTFLELSSVKKVQRFIYISEESHALEGQLVSLGKDSNARDAASNFAAVLGSFGSFLGDQLDKLPAGSEQLQAASINAEIAFQSAVLCDPLSLPFYPALAFYYFQSGHKDVSREVFREVDRMFQVLMDTEESSLSHSNVALRRNDGNLLVKLKEGVEQMKREYGLSAAQVDMNADEAMEEAVRLMIDTARGSAASIREALGNSIGNDANLEDEILILFFFFIDNWAVANLSDEQHNIVHLYLKYYYQYKAKESRWSESNIQAFLELCNKRNIAYHARTNPDIQRYFMGIANDFLARVAPSRTNDPLAIAIIVSHAKSLFDMADGMTDRTSVG